MTKAIYVMINPNVWVVGLIFTQVDISLMIGPLNLGYYFQMNEDLQMALSELEARHPMCLIKRF